MESTVWSLMFDLYTHIFQYKLPITIRHTYYIYIYYFQHLSLSSSSESVSTIYCLSNVPHRYFHLTNFFWMFVEGRLTSGAEKER